MGHRIQRTALEKIKADIKELTIDMTPDDEAAFKKLSLARVDAVFSNRACRDMICLHKLSSKEYPIRQAVQQSLKYYIGFSPEVYG